MKRGKATAVTKIIRIFARVGKIVQRQSGKASGDFAKKYFK